MMTKNVTGDAPVWIQIARCGQWQGHPSGPFKLGPSEFAEIVANFKATTNRRIPIDFEHASEMHPTTGTIPTLGAPAQGWIVDLDSRGPRGLWALVEWLEPARTYVKSGRYSYCSPTIRFNGRDPVTGHRQGCRLSSLALTNQPFLDGMLPVAAKDSYILNEAFRACPIGVDSNEEPPTITILSLAAMIQHANTRIGREEAIAMSERAMRARRVASFDGLNPSKTAS